MSKTETISILIADDKEVLRLGLKQIVSAIQGCEVIAETGDGPATVARANELRPRLVLIRVDLPLLDGVRATQTIKRNMPGVAVIMLLTHESDFFRAIHSGADGYIMRETPEDLIAAAIETVCGGGAWIGPLVARYLLHKDGLPLLRSVSLSSPEIPGLRSLTARERDVLRLLIKGLSNQKMANMLALKLETIKVHMRSIRKKLGAKGRAEIIARVLKAGGAI